MLVLRPREGAKLILKREITILTTFGPARWTLWRPEYPQTAPKECRSGGQIPVGFCRLPRVNAMFICHFFA
jgi:hypothetical protein